MDRTQDFSPFLLPASAPRLTQEHGITQNKLLKFTVDNFGFLTPMIEEESATKKIGLLGATLLPRIESRAYTLTHDFLLHCRQRSFPN